MTTTWDRTITFPRGTLRWWSPAGRVFCTQMTGHMAVDVVEPLISSFVAVHSEDPARKVKTFHDWVGATGYDSAARIAYTEAARPLMGDVDTIEFLLASRIIAMGVEVAKIVLGQSLQASVDRAAFERRRQDAIEAGGRRPGF
jgi:hypothetical protein